MTKQLYLLCGIPGSGKSTFRNYLVTQHSKKEDDVVVISPDDIRFYLTGDEMNYSVNPLTETIRRIRMEYAMRNEKIVIYDATNYIRNNRRFAIELAKKYGYTITAFVFKNFEEAQRRNSLRLEKVIPKTELDFMIKNWEEPDESEGIDEIIYPEAKDYRTLYHKYKTNYLKLKRQVRR